MYYVELNLYSNTSHLNTATTHHMEDGDIRLRSGNSALEGRVEIWHSGVWGTVCNNLWSRADAAVACRQLGYSSSGI